MPTTAWRGLWLWGVVFLPGCKADFSTPPNEPPHALSYPPGVTANLPRSQTIAGGYTIVEAVVTDHRGKPVRDVVVEWDRATAPYPSGPIRRLTDELGHSTFVWHFGATTGPAAVRATLPGADGSPLEYRAFVMPGRVTPPPGS